MKVAFAGMAGSGKTTALTKRIEFLVKYAGVNPNKILAITFTNLPESAITFFMAATSSAVLTKDSAIH